jgi:hypothetical protein
MAFSRFSLQVLGVVWDRQWCSILRYAHLPQVLWQRFAWLQRMPPLFGYVVFDIIGLLTHFKHHVTNILDYLGATKPRVLFVELIAKN